MRQASSKSFATRRRTALVGLAGILALSACGGGQGTGQATATGAASGGKVTLTWWHNATADPLKGFWQQVADDYTREHPNVTFEISPVQNEQFGTKLPVALQSDNPPDLFQEWGGGQMVTQVAAGKLKDITEATRPWIGSIGGQAAGWQVDGKQYGVPYSLGIVGFWYDRTLFAKAGITAPPATLDELLADVAALKAKGITPIAIGGKDRWPDAFWWDYFALRTCSRQTLVAAAKTYDFSDPCWVEAGRLTEKVIDAQPFQRGFLGTPAQQGAGSSAGLLANGKAAMELQGHWNPGVMASLTTDKAALAERLGWFPFPAVAGGAGAPDAALGGGDGFACSVSAPPECVDFLRYLLTPQVQAKFGALNVGLPVAKGSETSVSDPNLKGLLEFRAKSSYVQTYLDIAFVQSVGQALNDAIAQQFSGKADPEKVVELIAEAAKNR